MWRNSALIGVWQPDACFAFNPRSDIRRFYDLEGKIELVFPKRAPRMMTSEALVMGRFLRTLCWHAFDLQDSLAYFTFTLFRIGRMPALFVSSNHEHFLNSMNLADFVNHRHIDWLEYQY